MAKASNPVRLQVLLRPECRNEHGRKEATAALTKLGLKITGTGLTTISVRASSQVAGTLFGARPERSASGARSAADPGDLSVPDALTAQVERISIAPQHVTMRKNDAAKDPENDKETP